MKALPYTLALFFLLTVIAVWYASAQVTERSHTNNALVGTTAFHADSVAIWTTQPLLWFCQVLIDSAALGDTLWICNENDSTSTNLIKVIAVTTTPQYYMFVYPEHLIPRFIRMKSSKGYIRREIIWALMY